MPGPENQSDPIPEAQELLLDSPDNAALANLSGQFDEVNENRLQMLDELFGGGEAAFGILTTGGPGAACGRLLLLSHNLTVWPSVSGH